MSSETSEEMKALRSMRQERHKQWQAQNLEAIRNSGFRSLERDAAVLFREPGYPKADFYPHTGRWMEAGNPKVFRGGATAFLSWYESHKTAVPK